MTGPITARMRTINPSRNKKLPWHSYRRDILAGGMLAFLIAAYTAVFVIVGRLMTAAGH